MYTNLDEFKNYYEYQLRTPVIKQYLDIKYQNQQHIILCRIGEFYEIFFEDAIKVSSLLNINLTSKSGVKMCGIPYSSLNTYVPRLMDSGLSVAIAEQIGEKDNNATSIAIREIVKVITPGTFLDETCLDPKDTRYLLALAFEESSVSLAYADISTGDVNLESVDRQSLISAIKKIKPIEMILPAGIKHKELLLDLGIYTSMHHTTYDDITLSKVILSTYPSSKLLSDKVVTQSQKLALGILLAHILKTQKLLVNNLKEPHLLTQGSCMSIDAESARAIELMQTKDGKKYGSFLWMIDETLTALGGRFMKASILNPLNDIGQIKSRLSYTQFFAQRPKIMEEFAKLLINCGDLERIMGRIIQQNCSRQDLLSLKYSLTTCSEMKEKIIQEFGLNISLNVNAENIYQSLMFEYQMLDILESSMVDSPSTEEIIQSSYHPTIASLRSSIQQNRDKITNLKNSYKKISKIDNIKICENSIIGLYLEVPSKFAKNFDKQIFHYKQSTATSIRYKTDELEIIEKDIASHSILLMNLEKEIYEEICLSIIKYKSDIYRLARIIANVDFHIALARIARRNNYVMPNITENSDIIEIREGRHPVAEKILQKKNLEFTKNDLYFNNGVNTIILTGPNMGGKSTFLKQTALIAIMAQMGSFVPASHCTLGLVDRIFCLVETGDNTRDGKSTFMVEMESIASVIKSSTEKSLILLDESCRGTCTQDGIAISQALVEYLSAHKKSRNIFATHFLEIAHALEPSPYIQNLQLTAATKDGEISLTHLVSKGISQESLGLNIARVSGLPSSLLKRAEELVRISNIAC